MTHQICFVVEVFAYCGNILGLVFDTKIKVRAENLEEKYILRHKLN